MKNLIMVTVILFGIVSLAWGEPPVKQVEVVNDPFVYIQDQPVDVNVIDQSDEYEYKVFRIEDGSVTNAVVIFETALNDNAILGWGLVSFSYIQTPASTHIYVGVMKRLMQ